MLNKIFNDSQVVVFDEKGNIVETPESNSSQSQNFEKDPNATQMFETHKVSRDGVKMAWHPMLSTRQRALFFVALVALFFLIAWRVKEDSRKSAEEYNKAVESRTARGCKYPTMIVRGSKEGYSVDPDEGCAPE